MNSEFFAFIISINYTLLFPFYKLLKLKLLQFNPSNKPKRKKDIVLSFMAWGNCRHVLSWFHLVVHSHNVGGQTVEIVWEKICFVYMYPLSHALHAQVHVQHVVARVSVHVYNCCMSLQYFLSLQESQEALLLVL